MQRQPGIKKSDSTSVRGFGKIKTSSLEIIYLFIIVNILSCSTSTILNNQALNITDIDSAVKAACFTGSGRGQISLLSENYSFDFETTMDTSNEQWALGVSLPFYGEEIMRIGFKNAYEGNNQITGSFANRMFSSTQKISPEYKEILNKFLHKFALFLKFSTEVDANKHSCQNEKQEGYCKLISNDVFNYKYSSTRLELIFQENNNLSFHLVFSHGDAGKFRRIRAYYENHVESGLKRTPLRLDLILDNCM